MNINLPDSLKKPLSSKKDILISGLSGTSKSYFLQELYQGISSKILCLLPTEEEAYDLSGELKALLGQDRVFSFLTRDFVFRKDNPSISEVERISSLKNLLLEDRKKAIVVATAGAVLYQIMSPEEMRSQVLEIKLEQDISINEIVKRLVKMGYKRVDTVIAPGQIAVRGGLMDLFPVGDDSAYRIDFFGDFIESIKVIDLDSQRSAEKVQKLMIGPADELSAKDLEHSILDYLPEDGLVFFDESRDFYKSLDRQSKRYREYVQEARKEERGMRELPLLNREGIIEQVDRHQFIYHSFFPGNIPQVQVEHYEHISQKEMEPFYNRHEELFQRISEWQQNSYEVKLALNNKSLRAEIKGQLNDYGLNGVKLSTEQYARGFISPSFRIALVTDQDILGKKNNRKAQRKEKTESRLLVEDLKLGDYIVHENHGVGIYRGVTQVETDGVIREYILLQYAGTDKLYLPVDKLDLLHRYASAEEKQPRLSKLGGAEWEKTRSKVSQSIRDMAEELLQLYASRESVEGFKFSQDSPWQRQFEDNFPYQETPDQLKAIQDVKKDMESSKPMDRLVCGDVGYGKTEVAMRAAFKAVMDGKQVAILVPTTVLAEQHYENFMERFKEFPTNVEVLSRFKTSAQQKKVVQEVQKGSVDIIIATHRLLSRDIKFHNLGLLVIDEEHRFGVAQKEKIKALKKQVDVLSLSATPIPRSLHMALTGLRDLSVMETPPPERYPVTTYVIEYNNEIIREAILSEINRGGQVFFVHNRIQDIYRVKKELEEMLPELTVSLGHGRMPENELAKTMLDFQEGKSNVFLCTTIIESGLDIPNANTIIIDMADRMGLAQLYQLRGRVGRSNRMAYAYISYRPDKIITEDAQKRLNAIREFNELGSGMKIALRDLEIRGAGNMLGAEQHGYIHAVGFDMYCRLLEEETANLKGETKKEVLNPQLDIDADYYIPDSYIADSGSKMRIYRRLLLAFQQEELEEIKDEVEDRFGKMPAPVENFLQIALLRIQARDKHIKGLKRKGRELEIQLSHPVPPGLGEKLEGIRIKKAYDNILLLQGDKISLKDIETLLDSL